MTVGGGGGGVLGCEGFLRKFRSMYYFFPRIFGRKKYTFLVNYFRKIMQINIFVSPLGDVWVRGWVIGASGWGEGTRCGVRGFEGIISKSFRMLDR